jgi:hypothetical protein
MHSCDASDPEEWNCGHSARKLILRSRQYKSSQLYSEWSAWNDSNVHPRFFAKILSGDFLFDIRLPYF